jgi:hypothetical protein
MDTSQIIRLPKKYWELFDTMSNEEAWKLIKSLLWLEVEIGWLTKTYANIISVDLWNLEKSAVNWKKWGRPKKEETTGYENEKPKVIRNDNLKEREREREREGNIITDYSSIPIQERTVTQHLIVCFKDLWYVPAKNENEETLREWISWIAKLKSKSANEMIDVINWWHAYWKWNKKQVKNHKASLLNNYSLKW